MYKKGCITYYEEGDYVGPNKDILLLKKKYQDKSKKWHWDCRCPFCGETFTSVIGNLNNGGTSSCGCYKRSLISNDLVGKKFGYLLVLSKTKKRTSNRAIIWLCLCENCGRTKEISTESLKKGAISCGCINSKGENKIRNILDELNIKYYYDKPCFKDLIGFKNHKLRFDFYLPDYNCCIEYDGEQHQESKRPKAWESCKNLTEYDNIKNQYCINNHIKLIRIPYTDFKLINKEYLLNKIENYVPFNLEQWKLWVQQ